MQPDTHKHTLKRYFVYRFPVLSGKERLIWQVKHESPIAPGIRV